MGICYIVGSGNFSENIVKKSGDLIIAADGGYDSLIFNGCRPDLIIGDLDSTKCDLPKDIPVITFPREKDETDMILAYEHGRRLGYTEFILMGALGGERLDHSLGNLALLYRAKSEVGIKMKIIDGNTEIWCVVNGGIRFRAEPGTTFSVLPIGGPAADVTIIGAKYQVVNATLDPKMPIGISNECTDVDCLIGGVKGAILIISTKKFIAAIDRPRHTVLELDGEDVLVFDKTAYRI